MKISTLGASFPGVTDGVEDEERGWGIMLLWAEIPPTAVEAVDNVDSYFPALLPDDRLDFPEFGGSPGGVGDGPAFDVPSSAPS